MADSKENVRKITCPHCGATFVEGEEANDIEPTHGGPGMFRYLEDIVVYRNIERLKNGKVEIDGFYQSGEGYDDGTNPRFECRSCLHEFAVPEWVLESIEWV